MTSAVVDALRALRDGDRDGALQHSSGAAGSSLLADALTTHLRTAVANDGSVYTEPAAFQAFIAGGGNVALYEATGRALAAAYDTGDVRTVLDLGCGDGAAVLTALTTPTTQTAQAAPAAATPSFDLVEQSASLLDTALERLGALGVAATPHPVSAQEFVADLPDERRWDLLESTFALHALPPTERDDVLRALRDHVGELVVVEFDVPDLSTGTDAHLQFLADSYEQGLAEYGDDRTLVAQGFLVPVLIGQLAPQAARMTYEQPAARWAEALTRCGYRDVTTTELYPYWSSPAFVLRARGSAA